MTDHAQRVKWREELRTWSLDKLKEAAQKAADEMQTNRPTCAALIDELARRAR